ncbi:MAG: hypothetical protein H0U23_00755, partial [Blastocatellia bacterium]|nr:hypothetical protein [Blastocatellia bacterium]
MIALLAFGLCLYVLHRAFQLACHGAWVLAPSVARTAKKLKNTFLRWYLLRTPVALPLRAFASNCVLYTWEDWERDAKDEYPVRYFLQWSLPSIWRRATEPFRQAKYWLSSRVINRHHEVDLRNPGYRWGYTDPSEAILYACFNVLKNFVDNGGLTGASFTEFPEQAQREYEMNVLYLWWTEGRWIEHSNCEKALAQAIGDAEYKLALEWKEALGEDDQLMLARLINIRQYLWT